MFAVGCNRLSASDPKQDLFGPLSVACTLMVAIYALGGVCGGNFNPAVSIAIGLCRRMNKRTVACYCCVQLAAGAMASLSYTHMFRRSFDLGPRKGFEWWEVGIVEFIYTGMLCFVFLNCAVSTRNNPAHDKNQFFALAVGFVAAAAGYAAGGISGACLNPAVSFGIDISSGYTGFGWCFPYFSYQVAGSFLAALAFRCVRPEEFDRPQRAGGLGAKLAAEFIGTFALVFTVCLSILGKIKAIPLSAAAALMCMVYSLRDVSGGHFNPAVTLAAWLSGRGVIRGSCAAAFMGLQTAAGLSAVLLAEAVHHGDVTVLLPSGAQWQAVAAAEVVFTCALSFVFLSVTTAGEYEERQNNISGLAIGMCVAAGGFAVRSVSGGYFNPVVSLGLSSLEKRGGGPFWPCLAYSCFQFTGGILASVLFYATRPEMYPKAPLLVE